MVETSDLASIGSDETPLGLLRLALALVKKHRGDNPRLKAIGDELLDEVVVENAQHIAQLTKAVRLLTTYIVDTSWKDDPDQHLRPTEAHVRGALELVGGGLRASLDHRKDRMLFNAFFGSFRPDLHKAGMSKILLGLAAQLEYPHAELLRRIVAHPGSLGTRAREVDWHLALRLESLGLIRIDAAGGGGNLDANAISSKLLELVWGFDGDGPANAQ